MKKSKIRIFINPYHSYRYRPFQLDDSLKWVYNNEPKGEYYIKFF